MKPALPANLTSRFEVLGTLGAGAYGQVLRVQDAQGRAFALKLLEVEEDGAREEREIQAALRLRHPRVIHCYEAGVQDHQAYLLMEIAEGTLEDLLGDPGRRPEAWEYLRQAALGVHAIHQAGLIHRDLKPSNVLLTREGAKVGDLGLAKGADLKTLTQEGMVVGTPGYLAPEQARGDRVGPAADAFSLGVMFFQVLLGRLPYPEDTQIGLLTRVARGQVGGLGPLRDQLPGHLAPLLEAALSVNPAARPDNLAEWSQALGPFPPSLPERWPDWEEKEGRATERIERVPEPSLVPRTGRRPRPDALGRPRPKRGAGPSRWQPRRFLALLGVLGVVLVLGIGWGLRAPGKGPRQIRWHALGEAVSVWFQASDPGAYRVEVDGRVRPEVPVVESAGARLVVRDLPVGIPVAIRLLGPGASEERVELVPEALAISPTVRLDSGRTLRLEVLRPCRVRWEGASEAPRQLAAGFVLLPPPLEKASWVLHYEEGGVENTRSWSYPRLAEETIQDLSGALGEVDALQELSERFGKRLTAVFGDPPKPGDMDKELLESELVLWGHLDGWIPELLEGGASLPARRKLRDLWSSWSLYREVSRGLVEEEAGFLQLEGRAGSFCEDPPTEGRQVLPISLEIPEKPPQTKVWLKGENRYQGVDLVHNLVGSFLRIAVPSARFTWPKALSQAPSSTFRVVTRSFNWVYFVLRSRDPAQPFQMVLRSRDHRRTSTRVHQVNDGMDLVRRMVSYHDFQRIALGLTLPADLWPAPGTPMEISIYPLDTRWKPLAEVSELAWITPLAVPPGAGPPGDEG